MSKKSKKKSKKKKSRSTVEAARRRAKNHKAPFENTALDLPDEVPVFRLKSGKPVRIDILPYTVGEGNPYADEGELHYERTFWVHKGIGAEQTSFVCLSKTIGEKCPICQHRAKLMKDEDADEELIKDLAPKERQLFNVIDTADRDKGIQLWDISYHLFGKAMDARIKNADEDDEYEKFAELEDGLTLKCGIEEKSFGGRPYYNVETIDFKKRKTNYNEEMLEEVHNLDDIVKPLEYEELKAIFLQTDEDDSGSKKKSKKSRKKADEEEENFEEEEDSFEKGDRVIVEISDEPYPGVIKKIKDGEATVKFDDGDTNTYPLDELSPEEPEEPKELEEGEDSFEKGDRVIVEIDGEPFAGVIKKLNEDDEEATVKFDDGDTDTFPLLELSSEEPEEPEEGEEEFDESEFEDDEEGEEGEEPAAELGDLDKSSDEEDFDDFEDDIKENCDSADIDPDDYDTWKEAEMAARKKLAKKKSSKKSKKSKKSSKKK